MPGAARGDSTAPYEPQWGPTRGLRVSDSVHMRKLGVLLHIMRGDNASCDDLSVSASQATGLWLLYMTLELQLTWIIDESVVSELDK